MMNSIYFAYVVVTLAYFPVATAGYAAYGNEVNADVLLSVSQPPALIAVANFMVLVHIAASYQVSIWHEPNRNMHQLIRSTTASFATTIGSSYDCLGHTWHLRMTSTKSELVLM